MNKSERSLFIFSIVVVVLGSAPFIRGIADIVSLVASGGKASFDIMADKSVMGIINGGVYYIISGALQVFCGVLGVMAAKNMTKLSRQLIAVLVAVTWTISGFLVMFLNKNLNVMSLLASFVTLAYLLYTLIIKMLTTRRKKRRISIESMPLSGMTMNTKRKDFRNAIKRVSSKTKTTKKEHSIALSGKRQQKFNIGLRRKFKRKKIK